MTDSRSPVLLWIKRVLYALSLVGFFLPLAIIAKGNYSSINYFGMRLLTAQWGWIYALPVGTAGVFFIFSFLKLKKETDSMKSFFTAEGALMSALSAYILFFLPRLQGFLLPGQFFTGQIVALICWAAVFAINFTDTIFRFFYFIQHPCEFEDSPSFMVIRIGHVIMGVIPVIIALMFVYGTKSLDPIVRTMGLSALIFIVPFFFSGYFAVQGMKRKEKWALHDTIFRIILLLTVMAVLLTASFIAGR